MGIAGLALLGLVAIFVGCSPDDVVDRRKDILGQKNGPSKSPESASPGPQDNTTKPNPSNSQDAGPPLSTEPDQTKKIFALLVMGGYTSCNGGDKIDALDQNMSDLVAGVKPTVKLGDGEELRVLMSCYGIDPGRIYFSWEHEKKTQETTSIDKWVEVIGSFLLQKNAREKVRMGIVGHSYGGWTAMQVATKIIDLKSDRLNLLGLVTLDPISRVDCTPGGFIEATFTGQAQPGCQRAPTDMTGKELENIKKSTQWVNYYQTSVTVLHSGPIEGVTNKKKNYQGDGLDGHIEFVTDDTIYKDITGLFNK